MGLSVSDVERFLSSITYKPNWSFKVLTYPFYGGDTIYVKVSRLVPRREKPGSYEHLSGYDNKLLSTILEVPVEPGMTLRHFASMLQSHIFMLEHEDMRYWFLVRGEVFIATGPKRDDNGDVA